MTNDEVEAFLKLQSQLKSAYDEITVLSKKKPTDALNPFKLKFVNSMLSRANGVLGVDYLPFPEDFTLFEEADMPNNSDVVFILSHYLTAMEKLRCDNIVGEYMSWYWLVGGKESDKKTSPPEIC